MRVLGWMMLAGATMLAVAPASAQRYDPRYPVCLQVWEWGGSNYMNCSFTSWGQCQATASGLSAMCLNNPYWSQARQSGRGDRQRGYAY
jgi:Protein of unknown function (DUF3551)